MDLPTDRDAGASPGTPAWWDARYRDGETPWDTGTVPPEVRQLVASGEVVPGWALDLGCGSGVSARYLAHHGFRVVGVDMARSPLVRARRAAELEGVPAHFCLGDVADLSFLRLSTTLALDIGCYHSIPDERRDSYVFSLARRLAPGAIYLLYAFERQPQDGDAGPGISPRDIARFASRFVLRRTQHGWEGERRSAWYLMQRTRTSLPVAP